MSSLKQNCLWSWGERAGVETGRVVLRDQGSETEGKLSQTWISLPHRKAGQAGGPEQGAARWLL